MIPDQQASYGRVLAEEILGMSDLSLCEFGDIVWDEFCQSEDHTVPNPVVEESSELSFLGDRRKKPRHELIGVLGYAREDSANNNIFQEKDQGITVLNNRRKIMLEKNYRAQTPDGVFPSSCDSNSIKEVSSLASDGTRLSNHCFKSNDTDLLGNEFCTNDSMLVDKSAAVDSNSYNYPLGPMPQTDDDLSFFGNDSNDKDSSDLLYYAWPDIENFEAVDRMFRSCDSTFGLGAGNEDELGWFSSSDAIGGSGDMLKSECKVSSPSGTMAKDSAKHEPIRTNKACDLDDTSFKNASVCCKNNSWQSDKDESNTLGCLSLVNGMGSSDSKVDYRAKKQGVELNNEVQHKISANDHSTTGSNGMSNVHKEQQKHQSRCETKRKYPYGGSFYCNGSFSTEDEELPSEATSHQTLSSRGIQQQKQALGPASFRYLQNNIACMQSDYSHPSDHTMIFPALSDVKSDTNGFTSISPKESSYSSNQVLSAESSHGPAFQVTSAVPSEKREKLHHQQSFPSSFSSKAKDMDIGVRVPFSDPVSIEKKVQHSGKNFENHTGEGVPGEFGSSTMQESSSVSSGLDEISLEAASFCQLQLVMEQLDLRTKLRIRDGLYRLARSAEQRHSHVNLKGSHCGDDKDASGVPLTEAANKCTDLMDMETGTNPIDRSLAHLLFHRPSDPSVIPVQDTYLLSHPLCHKKQIHGSVSSTHVMPETSVNDEAMAAEMEKNVADG